ncbi:beta-ketoacyl-ACP synthase III [Alicyclobacillus sp. TC]|uniref:beta-ketoacyl-ACP synthase III n=1 Tax=Alicyclobacillus sp. TC TaxID=2606450 RepID=UPI002714ED12|nr:beta-ketoacyl-ACP synthase III [Alicyclobacillus sp. TC]
MGVRAKILGTGSAVPQRVLSNADLEKMVDTSDEWIVTRTGIRERRIAEANEATSDYVAKACERALTAAGVDASEVDLIVCGTVTPDMMFPATANLVQNAIGAKKAASFDLSAACSGFLYGLSLGASFIESGHFSYVLVVAGDLLSRITDYEDRSTCVLFGDGAGAVLLGRAEESEEAGILGFSLGSDGSGGHLLNMPAGGSRIPASAESVAARLHYLKMQGQETFKFAVNAMVSSTEEVLEKVGYQKEDISLLVPHQANIRIIDAARRRFGLPEDKVMVTIDKYGNTSASSIAIALDEAVREGRAKTGDLVVCVGFGGGLTWGSVAIRL